MWRRRYLHSPLQPPVLRHCRYITPIHLLLRPQRRPNTLRQLPQLWILIMGYHGIASVMSSESMVKLPESSVDEVVNRRRSSSTRFSSASTMRSKSPSSISQAYSSPTLNSPREATSDARVSVASMASDGEVGIGLSLLASLGEGDSDDDPENEFDDPPSYDTSNMKSVEDTFTDSGSSVGSLSVERQTLSPSPISEDAVAAFPRPPSTQVAIATTSDPVNPFGTFGRSAMSSGTLSGLDSIFRGNQRENAHDSRASTTSSTSFEAHSTISKDTDSSESGGATTVDHLTPQSPIRERAVEPERTRSPTLASIRSDSVYSPTNQRSPSIQASSPRNLSPPSPAFPPPNFRFPVKRPDDINLPAMSPSDILPPHSPTLSYTSGASASEWEGASDIYDNYLYRYSVASKSSRLSQMSMVSRSGIAHRNIPSTSTMPPTAIASMTSLINSSSNLRPPTSANPANAHTDKEEPLYTSLSAESTDSAESTETNATITPSRIPPRYDSLTMQRPSSVVASLRSLSSRRSIVSSHHTDSPHSNSDSDDESIYSRLSSKPSLSLLEAHAAALLAPENQEKVNTTSALNVVKNSPSSNATTFEKAFTAIKNGSRRPSPLDLTKDQLRTSATSTGGMTGPSPLLHTRWGSPVSSNGMSSGSAYDEKSSAGYPTPPFTDMRGSEDEKNRKKEVSSWIEKPRKSQEAKAETNELDSSLSTISRPLVIEDDEELPSHAMDPQDGEADMSLTTMESAEFHSADDTRNYIYSSTSSSKSKSRNESVGVAPILITPGVQPTSASFPSSGESGNSPISAISPNSPLMELLPPPSAASIPRPSLAELRGYSNSSVRGLRQSLFLPHPNAPKASLESPGPLYIRKIDNSPQLQPSQIRQGPDPSKVASNVLRMVLNTPPPHLPPVMLPPPSSMPIRGTTNRNPPPPPPSLPRGPTIYARVDVDLSTSNGPVPITFSIEPMGPPPPPLQSLAAFDSPQRQLPPSTFDQKHQQSQPPPISLTYVKRSVTTSASLPTNSVAHIEPQSRSNVVIPRENFTPQAPVSRPRSKSFSAGFKSARVSDNSSS
ncbi:hypothetical protein J3R30DRAFT_2177698 [Lentinula aciculospora]|uniref:Uncharacterized protein n=1 Tax=Lentinula aciculospora TaxID=153920 RepID=A0A9W9DRK7_9AGAR|nr:hypothetical protein J3R30DRAFT_2177698 [Lentinula aciculospora]